MDATLSSRLSESDELLRCEKRPPRVAEVGDQCIQCYIDAVISGFRLPGGDVGCQAVGGNGGKPNGHPVRVDIPRYEGISDHHAAQQRSDAKGSGDRAMCTIRGCHIAGGRDLRTRQRSAFDVAKQLVPVFACGLQEDGTLFGVASMTRT